jgi:hypothetical protein
MKTRQLFISLTVGLSLTLALLWLLIRLPQVARADSPHYVAPDCTGVPIPCHTTIQEAVDAAVSGDEILIVAGTYTGVSARAGVTQVVYISKAITIRGGYTTTNWTTPYPITQPTTLDAQKQGRVLYITGDISPTIEGLHITGGDAAGMGGVSFGDAGGGVYVITATVTMSNNQVFSNTGDYGGGLCFENSTDVTFTGNTVISNTVAITGSGGELCCTEEWEQLSPYGSSPPKIADHTAIYDEAHQQMITFGGCTSTTFITDVHCFITDTHVLDLTSGNENWGRLFPPGPSPWLESGHAAIYDADNGRMIVWGGKHATTDTYALDLTPCNEKWMTLPVTGTPPEGRMGHTAIYDTANERMIIFAGYFGEYPYFRNDVWALYLPLGEESWEVIFPLDPPPDPVPPRRAFHTAIYDAANQRMIVFGGVDFYWETLNDVWALDLTPGHKEWHEIFPSGISPVKRGNHSAIYDADNERMVVFGGVDFYWETLNDVWALDLTPGHEEWHEVFPSGISPAKRRNHSAIHDAANERMVILGGEDGDSYFNDVWALNEPPMMVPRIDKMGPPLVISGSTSNYTVTYENASAVTVTLSITDTLPPEVTYVGSTPPGTWVSATNVVSWTIPSQAPGISGTIVLTVTAPFTPCTRLVNTVEMITDPPSVLADDVWATRVRYGVYLPLVLKDYD